MNTDDLQKALGAALVAVLQGQYAGVDALARLVAFDYVDGEPIVVLVGEPIQPNRPNERDNHVFRKDD